MVGFADPVTCIAAVDVHTTVVRVDDHYYSSVHITRNMYSMQVYSQLQVLSHPKKREKFLVRKCMHIHMYIRMYVWRFEAREAVR